MEELLKRISAEMGALMCEVIRLQMQLEKLQSEISRRDGEQGIHNV